MAEIKTIGTAEITVMGEKVQVGITPQGTFFDLETKIFSAKTLSGLQAKMQKNAMPKHGISIETLEGKRGTVIAVIKKGWNSGNFQVRWEDKTVSNIGCYNQAALRPLTDAERAYIVELEAKEEAANAAANAARETKNSYIESLSIVPELRAAFPVK